MKNRIPFSLEDAKNGRKCYIDSPTKEELVHFVGLNRDGYIVCESNLGEILAFDSTWVFHLEEPIVKYINLYYSNRSRNIVTLLSYNTFDDAITNIAKNKSHLRYIKTIAVELNDDEIDED
jgi:hypothetical protein